MEEDFENPNSIILIFPFSFPFSWYIYSFHLEIYTKTFTCDVWMKEEGGENEAINIFSSLKKKIAGLRNARFKKVSQQLI